MARPLLLVALLAGIYYAPTWLVVGVCVLIGLLCEYIIRRDA
jgi:hypothetical protein